MWSLVEGEDYSGLEWAAEILATLGGGYILFYGVEQKRRNKVGADEIPSDCRWWMRQWKIKLRANQLKSVIRFRWKLYECGASVPGPGCGCVSVISLAWSPACGLGTNHLDVACCMTSLVFSSSMGVHWNEWGGLRSMGIRAPECKRVFRPHLSDVRLRVCVCVFV